MNAAQTCKLFVVLITCTLEYEEKRQLATRRGYQGDDQDKKYAAPVQYALEESTNEEERM